MRQPSKATFPGTRLLGWLLVLSGLAGAVLNANQSVYGFYIWAPSNLALAVINYRRRDLAQAALFMVYLFFALWGIWKWR